MRTRVKICCISSVEEAKLAIASGADALGLVSAMPSGPGPIDEALIAAIAAQVPPPVATFLLTRLQTADEIIVQHSRCCTNTLQLVDDVPTQELMKLRTALPGIKIVQVIHVADEDSVEQARGVAAHVNALLLDSGKPKEAIKQLGGTGRVHNWEISRRIVAASSVPVFLAGGLRAENVRGAIAQVRPYAVDICSGVRTDGKLDEAKLKGFMSEVRAACL